MSLAQHLPWIKCPPIINAPMGNQAGADLAIAVTRAGGLGQVGSAGDMAALEKHLNKVSSALSTTPEGLLPVGVGLLLFITDLSSALAVVEKYKPAVIWLFAAQEPEDYTTWTRSLRARCPKSQIWIQVGSVASALGVANSCKSDVLCIQGSDAGGHGFEKGAGIISLLPEVADALASAGHGDIPLVAAGGICDSRGAAAALILGAAGVVMGTRFLSSPEALLHPVYRKAILAASDGGQYTVRSKLFDELRGPNKWPINYDGRCIVSESFADFEGGVDIDEIRRLHGEAASGADHGFGVDGKGRAVMWAGTGVGLVRQGIGAGEIVEEVRDGVRRVLDRVQGKL